MYTMGANLNAKDHVHSYVMPTWQYERVLIRFGAEMTAKQQRVVVLFLDSDVADLVPLSRVCAIQYDAPGNEPSLGTGMYTGLIRTGIGTKREQNLSIVTTLEGIKKIARSQPGMPSDLRPYHAVTYLRENYVLPDGTRVTVEPSLDFYFFPSGNSSAVKIRSVDCARLTLRSEDSVTVMPLEHLIRELGGFRVFPGVNRNNSLRGSCARVPFSYL